jgi:hypothetical protein
MSLGSISPHVPQAPVDQRLQARTAEDNSCWHTAQTIVGIVALVFSTIAIGIALGPLAGVVAVVGFVLLRGLFSCVVDCCVNRNAHYHNHGLESSRVVHMDDGRHVHTGSGRAGHVVHAPTHREHAHPVLRGHIPTDRRHAHHGHPGHPGGDGLPPPSGPGGHVHTGRGHAAPHGHPGHPGGDGLPPPSGPEGHVRTGSGRRRG